MRALSLPLSIALAYLRNRKRQALVSILGVMMGVSFFIAIFAMMRGFQQYFVEKIIDVSPHVVMKDEYRNPPRQPIENAYPNTAIEIAGLKPKEDLRGLRAHQEILNALDQMPNLTYAPSLRAQAILRYGGRDVAATLSGISPEKERRVSTLDKDIIAGKIENLETYSDGIILGFGLAKKLGLRMGSRVSVISPSGVVLSMKVVGLFQT
ncbi:MAG: ABC transporter permease, partial [Holosporales bacterium]